MARIARTVLPGVPQHLTQHGNRRQQTLFTQSDERTYVALLGSVYGRNGPDERSRHEIGMMSTDSQIPVTAGHRSSMT